MSERLVNAREIALQIRDDCGTDAQALDRTPFTPRGMGETFGATLAMIAALALQVVTLADELEATNRTLASQTEHLV